jgi:hypothetical protein
MIGKATNLFLNCTYILSEFVVKNNNYFRQNQINFCFYAYQSIYREKMRMFLGVPVPEVKASASIGTDFSGG